MPRRRGKRNERDLVQHQDSSGKCLFCGGAWPCDDYRKDRSRALAEATEMSTMLNGSEQTVSLTRDELLSIISYLDSMVLIPDTETAKKVNSLIDRLERQVNPTNDA